MAKKYHINKNGIPEVCKANKRPCPLQSPHFPTYESALEYSDTYNRQRAVYEKYSKSSVYTVETEDYMAIVDKEPVITDAVKELAQENNGNLVGLEYRVKTLSSVKEKIEQRKEAKNINELWDVVRYTSLHDKETYYQDKERILNAFKEKGYIIHKEKDTWDSDGYKGINTKIKAPDGTQFELQFHTPESFEAKQQAHILYEVIRANDIDVLTKVEKEKEMNQLFNIPKPPKK